MTYFAQVDADGNVLRVIVADESFINSGAVGDPTSWVPTQKQYVNGTIPATVGGSYRKDLGSFIDKRPFDSWILDEATKKWVAPTPPTGPQDIWDEGLQSWVTYQSPIEEIM